MRVAVERKSLLWYILVRLIVLTSLLIAAVIIQLSATDPLPIVPLVDLILAAYFLSLVHFLLYLWGRHLSFQGYFQFILDLFIVTAFVYISGGLSSSTYFLYLFPVIGAGLVVSGRAAFMAASLSAIFFGLLVDGMYFKIIPYFLPEQSPEVSFGPVLFTVLIAWSVFFVVAALISYLGGELRKTRSALEQAQKELIIKERLAEAGRVSASLAHEIRNPLAAISGSVQVLKNEIRLNQEQGELMDIVLRESLRVSHSIDQFLDFALPSREVFSDINLSGILEETLKMLRGSGELDGGILVEGNFLAAGLRYFGNASQFKQVFWNLVKNAIKAMPEGGRLTVDFARDRKGIRLRFSDTGRGMSDEDKAHLFEPFYSGFGNGRGLGMAIVRRIIDDYDGTIEVASELRAGTTISIILPQRP